MKHRLMIGGLLCLLAAVGCSSNPPLLTDSSTSAIRAAEAVGANQTPRASLHLQLAKEELDGALILAKDGEADRATSMLLRAEADAELAILLSRESAEKQQAEQALAQVHKIRNEYR